MEGLAAVGRFKAGINRVVTPVIGVLAFIGAVVLLFMRYWIAAGLLALLSLLMFLSFKFSGMVQKDKNLQTASGAITAAGFVKDLLD